MATIKNVGKPVASDTGNPNQSLDLVDVNYVNTLLAANMSQSAVTSRINSNLSGFATNSYAASAMSGLATQAYVQSQDALYVPLSTAGQPNGPVPLSTLGKVSPGLINAPSTQQWPTPFYSPPAYQTSSVTTDTPSQLFTVAQPYPGFNYRLLVTGLMDSQVPLTDAPTCFPEVLIYEGSTSGPIIAFGYGLGESYAWGQAPLGSVSTTQLGNGTQWAQYYSVTTFGVWATPTAGVASWITNGTGAATCRCRNLDPAFATTTSNYQAVSITIGSTLINNGAASNDIYVRMDDTGTYYVRCKITDTKASLTYSLGGGAEVAIGTTVTSGITQAAGNVYTLYAGNFSTSNQRQFQLYKTVAGTSTLVGTWTDTNNASALGSAYRGWGFGASVGTYSTFFFITSEATPSSITKVTIADPANPSGGVNSSEVVILPTPLVNQTTQTGPTTLYVMAQSSDQTSANQGVAISTLLPGLTVTPIPWAA